MAGRSVTRRSLHEKFIENNDLSIELRKNRVFDYLKEFFHTNGNETATKALIEFTRKFVFATYMRNWKSVNRNNKRFLPKFALWLDKEITFPDIVRRCVPNNALLSTEPSTFTVLHEVGTYRPKLKY